MKNIFFDLLALSESNEDFVLATILERTGSAPRTSGARMAVRRDGSIIGTIGGGLLEAQVCQAAAEVFSTGTNCLQDYHFNARQASDLGMLCGGSVQILLEYIHAASHRDEVFEAVVAALQQRQPAWLVTGLRQGPVTASSVLQCVLQPEGQLQGTSPVSPAELLSLVKDVHGMEPQWVKTGDQRLLVEPIHSQGSLYIFGAGHVSHMLAPLAAWTGFYTVVVDDRVEFANRERFPSIDDVMLVTSYNDCFSNLDIDSDSYLVIVTRGHLDDRAVLEQALRTRAGYIGMIGSLRKRDLIYKKLREEGFTDTDLKRVHSPIGLAIGAETPEEIAISILAELIRHRAGILPS